MAGCFFKKQNKTVGKCKTSEILIFAFLKIQTMNLNQNGCPQSNLTEQKNDWLDEFSKNYLHLYFLCVGNGAYKE